MAERDEPEDGAPGPAAHLRPIQDPGRWSRGLFPVGFALVAIAVVLTFVAPSALWFLAYPILILGALAALGAAVALLIRLL